MPQFTLRGHAPGSTVTIKASDEREARRLAMNKIWGAPRPLRCPIPGSNPPRHFTIPHDGFDLDLLKVSP